MLVYAALPHTFLIYWFPSLQVLCLPQVLIAKIIATCIPEPQLQLSFMAGVFTIVNYFAFYEDKPWQNYALIGQLNIVLFVIHPVLYKVELNFGRVCGNIAIVMIFSLALTITSMVFTYITDLHQEMHTTNIENVKLLDGMHEGLLILSKKSH